jgi:ABC-type transport system involved in multi-copper enzyme maturation permease subunit
MIKLLKIELQKYLNYTTFWVLIGLHFVLLFLSVYIASKFDIGVFGFETYKFFQFPYVWRSVSYIASWFNILLTIILIIFVGNEFTFKTYQQNVINGLSRAELIYSKLILILAFSIYCFILTSLITISFGFFHTSNIDFFKIFQDSTFILIYFLQTIAYMVFGLFLVTFFRNTALSIVLYFLNFIIIEPIVRNIFPDEVGMFFPMKIITNLTPAPNIMHFAIEEQMKMGFGIFNQNAALNSFDFSVLAPNLIATLIYIIVFSFGSYFLMQRRDL